MSRVTVHGFRAIASKFGIIFDSKEINRLQIPLQKEALTSNLLHYVTI
jgi:hypothetical protein